MIDYEFRILSKTIENITKNKIGSEKKLLKSIPVNIFKKDYLLSSNKKYLNHAKKLNTLLVRGLPINNKKLYYEQELNFDQNLSILRKENSKIKIKKLIQTPNPKIIKFKEFENFLNKSIENNSGFELNSTWLDLSFIDKSFYPYFEYYNHKKATVALELDYLFRKNIDTIYNFLMVLRKYPNINFLLPHLGCGIFLHWEKVLDLTDSLPKLLCSSPKSLHWLEVFKISKFKKIPIVYASDHPLNGNTSIQIYNKFINYLKEKN